MQISFVVALAAALVLTPLARLAALRLGIVDYPDGKRKLHAKPTPLWGGVAVYFSLVLGLLVTQAVFPMRAGNHRFAATLIIAAGFVCLVGAIDDCWGLRSRIKLLLQTVSVVPIVVAGYTIERVVAFGQPISFGWLGVPLTIIWLVACINALNLLDGLDGLASVVGLSAAAMMAIIATNTGHHHVAVLCVVLAGALAGFLAYNLPPASIYLGDSGSMVIGLVVGTISIQGALKTSATLSIAVPAVLMSVPMLDTVLAIVRRRLTGTSIATADRGHIHHRLLDRGLSNWQALCIIGALCLATGAAATAATILRREAVAWTFGLSLIVLSVRTGVLGHHEVALIKRFVARHLARFARHLAEAAEPDEDPALDPRAAAAAKASAFTTSWIALETAARREAVERLELVVRRNGAEISRRRWCDETSPANEAARWTCAVSVVRKGGLSLELSATSRDSSLRPLEAAWPQQLARFLRRWADAPDMIPLSQIAGETSVAPIAGRIQPAVDEPDKRDRPRRDAA